MDHVFPSNRIPTVDELVAQGQYLQAAARFKAELKAQVPTAGEMLRLADLLVLAERGAEALPILLDVADTYTRHGYRDKALVALRRADAIEPAHPAVRERFESLAHAPRRRAWSWPKAPAPPREPAPKAPAAAPQGEAPASLSPADFAQSASPTAVKENKTNPFGHRAVDAEAEASEPDAELVLLVTDLGRRRGSGRAALFPALLGELDEVTLARLARGLHRRVFGVGEIVVSEGDPGESIFLVARGSVRILVLGGHGQPFEIRRLEADDFFGEVSALSGQPRSATVISASACELLEVERWVLDDRAAARPAARRILEEACAVRKESPEEAAVRSLSVEAASPGRAAEALRAHFGGTEWSPRVRLHLARLMLDSGQEADALAVLASVASELADSGHSDKAIAILKQAERIRRRAAEHLCLPSLTITQRFRPPEEEPVEEPPRTRAATEAGFRVWLGSLLRETDVLAAASVRPVAGGVEGKASPSPREAEPIKLSRLELG
jgi:CRP-like cAMP-binding protein